VVYWFTTWGYTTANPPNYNDLLAKSKIGIDAIKVIKKSHHYMCYF